MLVYAVPALYIAKTLLHCYRHLQYKTTDHGHTGTGTHSITQQIIATLVKTLTLSQYISVFYVPK